MSLLNKTLFALALFITLVSIVYSLPGESHITIGPVLNNSILLEGERSVNLKVYSASTGGNIIYNQSRVLNFTYGQAKFIMNNSLDNIDFFASPYIEIKIENQVLIYDRKNRSLWNNPQIVTYANESEFVNASGVQNEYWFNNVSEVIGAFSGCSGSMYLGADGACHSDSSGTDSQTLTYTPSTNILSISNGNSVNLSDLQDSVSGGGNSTEEIRNAINDSRIDNLTVNNMNIYSDRGSPALRLYPMNSTTGYTQIQFYPESKFNRITNSNQAYPYPEGDVLINVHKTQEDSGVVHRHFTIYSINSTNISVPRFVIPYNDDIANVTFTYSNLFFDRNRFINVQKISTIALGDLMIYSSGMNLTGNRFKINSDGENSDSQLLFYDPNNNKYVGLLYDKASWFGNAAYGFTLDYGLYINGSVVSRGDSNISNNKKLYVSGDMTINSDNGNADAYLYFGKPTSGTEYLMYDKASFPGASDTGFVFSDVTYFNQGIDVNKSLNTIGYGNFTGIVYGSDFYDSGVNINTLYQPLESTLTDIADGTIAENLVNTANPWADDEVADTITAGNVEGVDYGTMTNAYLCTYDSASTEVDCNTATTTFESSSSNNIDPDRLNGDSTDNDLIDDGLVSFTAQDSMDDGGYTISTGGIILNGTAVRKNIQMNSSGCVVIKGGSGAKFNVC